MRHCEEILVLNSNEKHQQPKAREPSGKYDLECVRERERELVCVIKN